MTKIAAECAGFKVEAARTSANECQRMPMSANECMPTV